MIHALYADDFLHFTNSKTLYLDFQKQSKNILMSRQVHLVFLFVIKISVDRDKLTVDLNQTEYVHELLNSFSISDFIPLSTPIIHWLSLQDGGAKLSAEEHVQACNIGI